MKEFTFNDVPQALSLLLDKVNHLEQLIASQRKLRFFASFRLRLIKKLITLFFCFATHQQYSSNLSYVPLRQSIHSNSRDPLTEDVELLGEFSFLP